MENRVSKQEQQSIGATMCAVMAAVALQSWTRVFQQEQETTGIPMGAVVAALM